MVLALFAAPSLAASIPFMSSEFDHLLDIPRLLYGSLSDPTCRGTTPSFLVLLASRILSATMSDQKVFLFGSFTEDETRLFQGKPADKSVSPLEKIGLQFGSLDFNALSSVKGFCSEFKPNAATKAKNFPVTIFSTESIEYKYGDAVIGQTVKEYEEVEPYLTANGCVPISDESITDGCIYKGMDSFHALEDEKCSRDLLCTAAHGDGFEIFKDHNGLFRSPAASVDSAEDILKKSSECKPPLRSLLPRGLINLGNLCFLNATLQALLSCSPFVQLLLDLRNRNVSIVGYPTLHAFAEFITEFFLPDDATPKNERVVEGGKPFSPMMFETVLRKFTPDLASCMGARPRQEDAQEFLSFLMDQMHNELLKLDGHLSGSNGGRLPLVSASEDDGWETVGPKNKSAITRTQSFMPSELSAIFGGQLRSVVKAKGNKASATVQPFLLLHLDILPEAVHTIEDALHLFSAPETLEGYRAFSGKAGLVSASKSVKMQTLSKILILHLMRFSYGSSGSTKLHKPIHFPLELVLGRELLVTPATEGRKYELVATITHHGREHSKGHYTADSRYSNGQWLRYDDSSITAVGTNKVLHDQAYVLFYKQIVM